MKAIHYLLIALFCFVVILYHFIFNHNIIGHPYMFWLFMILFGSGGYCAGTGIGKIIKGES